MYPAFFDAKVPPGIFVVRTIGNISRNVSNPGLHVEPPGDYKCLLPEFFLNSFSTVSLTAKMYAAKLIYTEFYVRMIPWNFSYLS